MMSRCATPMASVLVVHVVAVHVMPMNFPLGP